jgi:hypothetical protein
VLTGEASLPNQGASYRYYSEFAEARAQASGSRSAGGSP